MAALVCAATRTELVACGRGLRASGAPASAFSTLLTGVGPSHATRALERRLERGPRPDLVVSSGFAGAIAETLSVGDWVTATRLSRLRASEPCDVDVVLRRGPGLAAPCAIVSCEALVVDARQLPAAARAFDAVDMESAALAEVAARHGIDFMVLRMLSDTPKRPLPGFLGAFGRAMAATSAREAIANGARGLGGTVRDPRGVARLLREGRNLARALSDGWARFPAEISGALP
jgi:adenosylhomocysteine nucleosidase